MHAGVADPATDLAVFKGPAWQRLLQLMMMMLIRREGGADDLDHRPVVLSSRPQDRL